MCVALSLGVALAQAGPVAEDYPYPPPRAKIYDTFIGVGWLAAGFWTNLSELWAYGPDPIPAPPGDFNCLDNQPYNNVVYLYGSHTTDDDEPPIERICTEVIPRNTVIMASLASGAWSNAPEDFANGEDLTVPEKYAVVADYSELSPRDANDPNDFYVCDLDADLTGGHPRQKTLFNTLHVATPPFHFTMLDEQGRDVSDPEAVANGYFHTGRLKYPGTYKLHLEGTYCLPNPDDPNHPIITHKTNTTYQFTVR